MSGPEVFRVDRFVVPDGAVEEFMIGVHRTHRLLREQPGFRYDLLLEGERTAGTTRIVTVVAWADEPSIAAARAAVREMQREAGFSPADTFTRLGIDAEIGTYTPAATEAAR